MTMEPKTKSIRISRTQTGIPALWESLIQIDETSASVPAGEAPRKLYRSIVITDRNGKLKNSIYVKTHNDKQALVPVEAGDLIIKAYENRDGVTVTVLEITEISALRNQAEVTAVGRQERDSPGVELAPGHEHLRDILADGVSAAISKVATKDIDLFYCRLAIKK